MAILKGLTSGVDKQPVAWKSREALGHDSLESGGNDTEEASMRPPRLVIKKYESGSSSIVDVP
jgi:hypothetical protein